SPYGVSHRRFRLTFSRHCRFFKARARSVYFTLVLEVLLCNVTAREKAMRTIRRKQKAHGNGTHLSDTWHSKRKLLIWLLML
ncbi:hypothetical protein, partial [Photobacterium sp. GB-3]|uniref:hypothetical protein n=1 Tax=Photobacterium sp. GB-3 TaxID=2022110 RepID=UPI001E52225A